LKKRRKRSGKRSKALSALKKHQANGELKEEDEMQSNKPKAPFENNAPLLWSQ